MQAPLFLISLCFLLVSAVYDPNQPHQTENFDPAEADPQGNITCLGDRYGIDLPIITGFNPNLVTMQELCAKPQYNGGLPGQHVGVWCAPIMSQRGQPRRLAYDPSPGAQVNAALAVPRVLLGCLLRCYCNSAAGADLTVQPVTTDVALRGGYRQSRSTYEIKIDVVDDFDVPSIQHMGSLVGQLIISVSALLKAQISTSHYNYDVTPISVDQQNRIECRGSLPSFPLPHPFEASQFGRLQDLCAVQFFGGNLYVPLHVHFAHLIHLIQDPHLVPRTPAATVTAPPSPRANSHTQSGSPMNSHPD